MNYKKHYARLIRKRLKNPITEGYTEKHHIHPRSLGGSDSEKNLVALTAKEHFIAHLLLTKMYEKGSKSYESMLLAFNWMRYGRGNKSNNFTSNRFSKVKEEVALIQSKRCKGTAYYYSYRLGISKRFEKGQEIPEGFVKGKCPKIPRDELKKALEKNTRIQVANNLGVHIETLRRWVRVYQLQDTKRHTKDPFVSEGKPSKCVLEKDLKKHTYSDLLKKYKVNKNVFHSWVKEYELLETFHTLLP